MRAGRLRHHVEVQQATETQDEYGGMTLVWETIEQRTASIRPMGGRELFEAQQVVATASHEVRMRYTSTITPQLRLLFGTRIFEIGQVINVDERNRELVLLCTEKVAV